jgi:hypothetical protein
MSLLVVGQDFLYRIVQVISQRPEDEILVAIE